MADFCKQCSDDILGIVETNDMIGLVTVEENDRGLYADVLCEGCGFTQVDHEGNCIHHDEPGHSEGTVDMYSASLRRR